MTPAPLHGLQDWYLRASDGEWDAAPGIRVDPLDAAHAWARLPTGDGASPAREPGAPTRADGSSSGRSARP